VCICLSSNSSVIPHGITNILTCTWPHKAVHQLRGSSYISSFPFCWSIKNFLWNFLDISKCFFGGRSIYSHVPNWISHNQSHYNLGELLAKGKLHWSVTTVFSKKIYVFYFVRYFCWKCIFLNNITKAYETFLSTKISLKNKNITKAFFNNYN
jgi:hypothetical protein